MAQNLPKALKLFRVDSNLLKIAQIKSELLKMQSISTNFEVHLTQFYQLRAQFKCV